MTVLEESDSTSSEYFRLVAAGWLLGLYILTKEVSVLLPPLFGLALLVYPQRMSLRNILAASLASYADDETDGGERLHFLEFPPDVVISGRSVLVIDDIWDSGRTAVTVRRRLIEAGAKPFIVVLHYKPKSSIFPEQSPDLFAEETSAWIEYPWELESS